MRTALDRAACDGVSRRRSVAIRTQRAAHAVGFALVLDNAAMAPFSGCEWLCEFCTSFFPQQMYLPPLCTPPPHVGPVPPHWGGGLHNTIMALKLQQLQYNQKKIVLRRVRRQVFPTLFYQSDAPHPPQLHSVGPNFSHHKARVQAVGWFLVGTRKQGSRPFAAPTPPNRNGAGPKAGPAPPPPPACPHTLTAGRHMVIQVPQGADAERQVCWDLGPAW